MVGIAADTATSAVLLPLHRIAAAEELIVVVVDGIWVTEAPHGIPGRWIHQATVAQDRGQLDVEQQYSQLEGEMKRVLFNKETGSESGH